MTDTNVSVLEILADPELLKARAGELLAAAKSAETVQAKAIAAKIEADQAFKAAADETAKQRELQEINTKKSAALRDQATALAEQAEAMRAAKADDGARLTEWEQRLKAQADAQSVIQAEMDQRVNALASEREAFNAQAADAQEIIARAERINAAMGA